MHPLIQKIHNEKRNPLEPEAWEILKDYGLPVPLFRWVRSAREAREVSSALGFPLVMKVVSPDIIHKTEVGGVLTGLKNRRDVEAGYREIEGSIRNSVPDVRFEGVLLAPQLPKATEIILGKIDDPRLGPTIMLGLGGIFAETLKDVTFRLLPVTPFDAGDMLDDLTFRSVLEGVRGKPAADREGLIRGILRFSRLMEENPVIAQCDLNPILLYEKELFVVDARMSLS